MKGKGSLILGASVLVLGLYAYFGEYKKEAREQEEKNKKSQIITLKKDQIQEIIIETPAEKLMMSRSKNGWDLSGPLQDEADNDIVESLIDQVMQEKAVDRISITPAVDLAQYGFSKSLGSISFIDNQEKKQSITISPQKNFEGLYFLRNNQDPEILTSGESWFSFISKPATHFLNLKLFRFLPSQVDRIEIQNFKDQYSLQYKDAFWKSDLHPQWEIDQNQIRDLLSQVSQAKGIEPFKGSLTGKPSMQSSFKGDKFLWTAAFYKDPKSKDWLVKVSNPPLQIRFGPQLLEKVTDLSLLDLRDKSLPFQFRKDEVSQIKWKTNLKSQKLKKLNSSWILDPPDPGFVVDEGSVTLLLDKLKNLKVYRYPERPVNKIDLVNLIELKNGEDETLFAFEWTAFKNNEGFAKSSIFSEVFMMDDAQVSNLGLHKILKPSEKAKK